MKKNNPYLADDEIDLGDLLRTLWREKILILFIIIICSLLGYLYGSFKPEEFKTEIKIKNPPPQLFVPYSQFFISNVNNNKVNNNSITEQFISDFQLNFLSLDNLEIFVEESRDLDTFKTYLKSRNISAKQYFEKKFGEAKEKNIIIPNTYFLVFEKKILDGNIFLNNYANYVKKKNIIEFKKNLKLMIEHRINITDDALETAKLINLDNPILKSADRQSQVINEPEALFYKGTKVLGQSIIIDKKLLQKLENDQFNYNQEFDKASAHIEISRYSNSYYLVGLFFGLVLSFIIIFFKSVLKNT